jgi:putative ABC transport system permease protein
VVGVVADVRLRGVTGSDSPQVYVPMAQAFPAGSAAIAIDPDGDPDAVLEVARRVLRDLDPELPLYNVIRLADLSAQYLATERLIAGMTGVFSGMALALCAIGLFGVLAQLVAQRTREIGIRMALGADRARLQRSVVGTGLKVAAAGVVIGLVLVAGLSQTLTTLTPSIDRPPMVAVGLDVAVLLVVALGAAWIPARRASRVDPIVALRVE